MIKCPVVGTPTATLVKDTGFAPASTTRAKPVNEPATRPVYVNDDRSRKAFAIAQRIADMRMQIKVLEREYAQYSGVHSDPNIDLRQLQFAFADKYVTVHIPKSVTELFNSCAKAIS